MTTWYTYSANNILSRFLFLLYYDHIIIEEAQVHSQFNR